MHNKRQRKLSFTVCNNIVSAKRMAIYHITPFTDIVAVVVKDMAKPVLSLWNSLSGVIFSKSNVLSLKHVQCS